MKQAARTRTIRQVAIDFAIGVMVFVGLAGIAGADRGSAFPAPPPPELTRMADLGLSHTENASDAHYRAAFLAPPSIVAPANDARTSNALVLLALSFATLTALNLTLYRHLRRVYASPRRGAWGRD